MRLITNTLIHYPGVLCLLLTGVVTSDMDALWNPPSLIPEVERPPGPTFPG